MPGPTTRARTTQSSPAASRSALKASKTTAPTVRPPVDPFPFAQYVSVLGVHLVLVVFTTLYLPQTTRLFAPLAARETDRPQSEFMETLTTNPCSTLGWVFTGLVLLQLWWANWMRKWSFARLAKGTEAEIKLDRVRFDSLRFTRLKDAAAFTLCTALATHVVVVVFGAPLTTHVLQTALLASTIAILTAFTPAFILGSPSWSSDTPSMVNRLTWTRLFAERSPRNAIEYAMVYPACGTFIGGWLGAIPIALDWDRPWQAWPLTSFFGSIGGYIIGSLFAFASITTHRLAAEHVQSPTPGRTKSR